ncbi:MAG: hypothetical protein Q9200_000582 [Gallowayella weberi]
MWKIFEDPPFSETTSFADDWHNFKNKIQAVLGLDKKKKKREAEEAAAWPYKEFWTEFGELRRVEKEKIREEKEKEAREKEEKEKEKEEKEKEERKKEEKEKEEEEQLEDPFRDPVAGEDADQ